MNLWSDIMNKFYDLIIDNVYLFCFIIALLLVIFVTLLYLVRVNKHKNDDEEYQDNSLKSKDELEKISDDEIEKRVINEALEDEKEVKEKLDEIENDNKGNTEIAQIIDSLKSATPSKATEALKKFEEEQEENAIISYQQLVNAVNKTDNNSVSEELPVDDISGESLEETIKLLEKYDILNEEIENEPIVSKDYSYKPNEFISPVFGRMDSSNVHYREGLSYTDKKDYKKGDEQNNIEKHIIEKPQHTDYSFEYKGNLGFQTKKLDSEEFLRNLKEFRKGL